jgi:hypothetical protein
LSLPDSSFTRLLIAASALVLICVSQSFWFMRAWRFCQSRQGGTFSGIVAYVVRCQLGAIGFGALSKLQLQTRRHPDWRDMALSGLWISSALFAYLSVKFVVLAA